jgi:hypothetical protein
MVALVRVYRQIARKGLSGKALHPISAYGAIDLESQATHSPGLHKYSPLLLEYQIA